MAPWRQNAMAPCAVLVAMATVLALLAKGGDALTCDGFSVIDVVVYDNLAEGENCRDEAGETQQIVRRCLDGLNCESDGSGARTCRPTAQWGEPCSPDASADDAAPPTCRLEDGGDPTGLACANTGAGNECRWTSAVGDACHDDLDCASAGARCRLPEGSTGAAADGVCNGSGALGDPCTIFDVCADGLACAGGRCAPWGQDGDACGGTGDSPCAAGLLCDAGRCGRYYARPNGAAADDGVACESGYRDPNNGECAGRRRDARAETGQACGSDDDCTFAADQCACAGSRSGTCARTGLAVRDATRALNECVRASTCTGNSGAAPFSCVRDFCSDQLFDAACREQEALYDTLSPGVDVPGAVDAACSGAADVGPHVGAVIVAAAAVVAGALQRRA